MKLDLHLHSSFSWDSDVPIKNYISVAEEQGFGAISITDHNNTKSHSIIKKLQEQTNVILIPGQEISTLDGHLLVYGEIPSIQEKLPMSETVAKAKTYAENQNIPVLTIAAHPFDKFRSGKGRKVTEFGIDGFEVLNASTWLNYFNKKAQKYGKTKQDMIQLGNSDSHRITEFGTAYTVIEEARDITTIFEKLWVGSTGGSTIGVRRKLTRFTKRKIRRN